jgi:pimeloyl-ACP methyl ester carboxylesterase
VLALDTPGYGASDPLDLASPAIEDFAAATAATLDALGVERCSLYGAHTGAAIALELANRDPDRVSAAVLDGLPVYTDSESAELLEHYVPAFEPRPDGSHLVSLWASYRDRFLFSPWFRQELSTRRDLDLPDEDELHAGVMDILRAGEGYGVAYAAAFRYRAHPAVAGLAVPAMILARDGDVLTDHVERLPELPAGVAVRRLPAGRTPSAELISSFLSEHASGETMSRPPPSGPVVGRVWHDYADTSYGQLFVRRSGEGDGTPLVMLHASPGSGRMLVGLLRRLATARRPVLAPDTLGNGDSDKPAWEHAEIADYAPVVAEATAALGLERFDLYGSHTGALIAIETALLVPDRVRRLVLDGVALFDEQETADLLSHYTPPLRPARDGTHLLFAWHFLRDQTLFWPWYNGTRAGIRWVDPIAADQLHAWCVELLKSGHTYPIAYRAAFSYPTRERIPLLRTRALLVASETDMLHASTHEAASLSPFAEAQTLPDDDEHAARMIAAFLDAPD